jgi:hypothetical protein
MLTVIFSILAINNIIASEFWLGAPDRKKSADSLASRASVPSDQEPVSLPQDALQGIGKEYASATDFIWALTLYRSQKQLMGAI